MIKALITGGNGGIGAAIKKALSEWMNVELVYSYDIENGNNVCDYDQVQRHIAALGKIDLLVKCAGVCEMIPFADQDTHMYQRMININLIGTMNVCHAAIPYLEGGDIINIASRAGAYGHAGLAAYCASKAGVMQFSEALALDLRPHNIRVGYIMPGTVATGLGDVHPIEDWQIQPEHVARAVIGMWCMPRGSALGRVEIKPSLLGGKLQ